LKEEIHDNFTKIPNGLLMDKNLSMTARGLFCWMLSCSENWHFSVHGTAQVFREGEYCLRNAMRRLEECGYLERRVVREKGRIIRHDYILHPIPVVKEENTGSGLTACGKTDIGETDPAVSSEPSTAAPAAEQPRAGNSPVAYQTQTKTIVTKNKVTKTEESNIKQREREPARSEGDKSDSFSGDRFSGRGKTGWEEYREADTEWGGFDRYPF